MTLFLIAALATVDPPEAIVRVELIAPARGSLTSSQQWARVFAKHDVRVTVRSSRPGDELGVVEDPKGRLRFVTVTAALDNGGEIRLPGQRYSLADRRAVDKWIAGLKTFGAAGTPDESLGYGLTPTQWRDVCLRAARTAPTTPQSPTVADVLRRLSDATGLSVDADALTARQSQRPCDRPDEMLSVGVGSAIALHAAELGIRPRRQPDGSVRWVVEEWSDEAWPLGWAVPKGTPRMPVVGAAFQRTQMPDVATLADLLPALAEQTGVPHVPLSRELSESLPQWREVPSVVRPVGAPAMELVRLLRAHRLTREFRWDDAGRGFVIARGQDMLRVATPREVRPPAVLAAEAAATSP